MAARVSWRRRLGFPGEGVDGEGKRAGTAYGEPLSLSLHGRGGGPSMAGDDDDALYPATKGEMPRPSSPQSPEANGTRKDGNAPGGHPKQQVTPPRDTVLT